MIQRIQTLYLLLGLALGVAMAFFPYANVFVGSDFAHLYTTKIVSSSSFLSPEGIFYIGMALNGILVLGMLIAIFLFKNRILQMRVNAFLFLLNAGLIAFILFFPDRIVKSLGGSVNYVFPGVVFPIVLLILLIIANRAIKKDELKVRAADRLRK